MPKIWLSSSEDKSCDSIQQALDSAAAGDTLYLSHGNYALNDPLQIRQKIRICPAPDATEQVTMNFFFLYIFRCSEENYRFIHNIYLSVEVLILRILFPGQIFKICLHHS